MNTNKHSIIKALSPLPLCVLLGWSLGAGILEGHPDLAIPLVEAHSLPGAQEFPTRSGVQPLDLRRVAGVGRTRSRDLASGFWERGWGASELKSSTSLEQVTGIGPVTATAVKHWAESGALGAYTGAQELHPANASPPPKSIRVHRKRATPRSPAGLTQQPAPVIP